MGEFAAGTAFCYPEWTIGIILGRAGPLASLREQCRASCSRCAADAICKNALTREFFRDIVIALNLYRRNGAEPLLLARWYANARASRNWGRASKQTVRERDWNSLKHREA